MPTPITALAAAGVLAAMPLGAADIETITLSTASGDSFSVLVAGATDAPSGVVVVHDWFGISEQTRDAVRRLAALGHRALAVDLYGGQSATTHQDAWTLMSDLDAELAAAKLAAAIDSLSRSGRRIAVIGFSMGVPHAIDASLAAGNTVAATVGVYGDSPHESQRLRALGGPVLLVAGSRDGTSPEDALAFLKRAEAAERLAEVYVYPGVGHAFAQPLFNDGKNFDATATRAAWLVVGDFLARHLKPAH